MTEAYTNAYVDGEFGERVVLLWRDESGHQARRSIPAEYVSFHKLSQIPDDFRRDIEQSRFVKSARVEGEWYRIGWRDRQVRDDMCNGVGPEKLSPLRERGIEHYEADVHPVRRYMTDTGAAIQKPRRCYLDFEGDSRVSFSRKEDARVLAWAVTDDDGNRYQGVLEEDTDDAEQALLARLWEIFRPYDQVLAWNGDGYDFPVLKARSRARGIRVDTRRLLLLDQLALFRKMNMHSAESGEEKTSFALNAIAKALLGKGKKDFDARYTWQAWQNATPCVGAVEEDDSRRCGRCRKCMADYNLEDAALLPEIEKKVGYADLLNTLCEVCHAFPDTRGLNPTNQMDGFMLRLGVERGLHFASKKFRDVEDEQYLGAWVMQPKENAGILRDVHVFDFAALYPSIIITWNISPETKRPDPGKDADLKALGLCRCPLTGICFDVTKKGVLPTALDELLALRKFWKDKKASLPPGSPEWHDANRKDNAYKVAANSLYGVVGSMYSRFYDRDAAESVTQNGKWLLEQTLKAAEARGWKAVYGDTDSGFVAGVDRTAFLEFIRWCNATLYPTIVAEQGCVENRIKNDNEKGFRVLVFVSAKRYVGYYNYYKGKDADPSDIDAREIKGLEYKRGDSALLARRLQESVIDLLHKELRPDPYRDAVRASLEHVLRDELPVEEVAISQSLTKELSEYAVTKKTDGTPGAVLPHVQVAHILEQRGQRVAKGERMRYVVVDGYDETLRVVPADDYDPRDPERNQFDRFHLWEKKVYPPTLRLLQAAFPSTNWTDGLERVRPPRGRRAKPALPNQLGFFMTTGGPINPFTLGLDADLLTDEALVAVKEIVARYPGHRPLVFQLRLETGTSVILDARARVSAAPAMIAEIDKVLWEVASRHLLVE